ncbi:MAG: RidA family protein [Chloroflexota bacterium]
MKEVISTSGAPAAVGPYSQGIKFGNMLFTAGQVPLDPVTGKMVEGDISAQATRVMESLKAILEEAGTNFDNVVKTTVFMADLGHYKAFNDVYASYFNEAPPARSAFQVAGLPLGALVEVEMIAVIG